MPDPFYIVGPTAVGKSALAAAVAAECGAEIVSADAYQIYAGLDSLTAKPSADILEQVRHHLVGSHPLGEPMNAAIFRAKALDLLRDIAARGKRALIVGGSGMYIQALTHGLSDLPGADRAIRERFESESLERLIKRLTRADPQTAATIDRNNRHRIIRALEICELSGSPASTLRRRSAPAGILHGVLLFRERDEMRKRIDARVQQMFADGVVEEVANAGGAVGPTAAKTLGLADIRELIAGRISEAECIERIQRATRQYAKRQLTWFRRQTSFEPLNLSLQNHSAAVEWITRKARLSFAQVG